MKTTDRLSATNAIAASVKISDDYIAPPKVYWTVKCIAGEEKGIASLEQFVAGQLAVEVAGGAPIIGMPLAYETEIDARRVAIGMMWLKPELHISVCSSDGTMFYAPLAHTSITIAKESFELAEARPLP